MSRQKYCHDSLFNVKRVLEPELMDSFAQALAYSEADFSLSDRGFMEALAKYLIESGQAIFSDHVIIDLGCGPGKITELLANQWPQCQVCGIDGAEVMLDLARKRKDQFLPHVKSLKYLRRNIASLADTNKKTNLKGNLLVSNSLLHHLHDPLELWRTLINLSCPESIVFHRDLRRPESKVKALEIQQKYLPIAPQVLIDDYLASLQASFTVAEVKLQLQQFNLGHWNVVEVDDRYLEISGTF